MSDLIMCEKCRLSVDVKNITVYWEQRFFERKLFGVTTREYPGYTVPTPKHNDCGGVVRVVN